MTASKAWWQLFTLTGNIEAYLLYRGIFATDPLLEGSGRQYRGRGGVFLALELEKAPAGTSAAADGGSPAGKKGDCQGEA
jgi:hypothetical protein